MMKFPEVFLFFVTLPSVMGFLCYAIWIRLRAAKNAKVAFRVVKGEHVPREVVRRLKIWTAWCCLTAIVALLSSHLMK
jgi:hypothetical protein